MRVIKEKLEQYCELIEEIKDLERRKLKKEEEIRKIKAAGQVSDVVKGGLGGKQNYKVTGFPNREHEKHIRLLNIYTNKLTRSEIKLLETINEIEDHIQEINDSRIRKIIRYRFIDDLKWRQVAIKMGGRTTEDSVKKEFERFLCKN